MWDVLNFLLFMAVLIMVLFMLDHILLILTGHAD